MTEQSTPSGATFAADMCPRCKGDNAEAWALCPRCAEPADPLRERYAAAIVAGGGCVDLAAAISAVLAVRDAELEALRTQVARVREFAELHAIRDLLALLDREASAAADPDARARARFAAVQRARLVAQPDTDGSGR